jgi:hypothetical protein
MTKMYMNIIANYDLNTAESNYSSPMKTNCDMVQFQHEPRLFSTESATTHNPHDSLVLTRFVTKRETPVKRITILSA